MLNEKNIGVLKEQLLALGLPPEIEYQLKANICLQPDHFLIKLRDVKEDDIINSAFYFERDGNDYHFRYYECCLRKKIFIPDDILNDIDGKQLEKIMAAIDWNTFSMHGGTKQQEEGTEEIIEGIVTELKNLSSTPEGYYLAGRLKVKFWLDTPLVSFIPNINSIRNQYEISQRFYFFEGEAQISLDEAYRFLCHRWREKQLNAKKKQAGSDGSGNNAADDVQKDKLLSKKKSKKGKVTLSK
jgi:hypothetical protein